MRLVGWDRGFYRSYGLALGVPRATLALTLSRLLERGLERAAGAYKNN